MKVNVIGLDTGILLTKEDKEFHFYSCVYDNKYGYYDENQAVEKLSNLAQLIEYAKRYVVNGVDMTYAAITNQGQRDYCEDEEFNTGDIDGFTYSCEDVIFSVAKINGKIIENFIKKSTQ